MVEGRARGTLADAEVDDRLHLLKSASSLHATYQVRLLLFRATTEGKRLVLNVRQDCHFHDDLQSLINKYGAHIEVVRR